MSVKLSNVAHPVSVVAAGVSPQPTSDASIDTASSTATSSGSNARDQAGKQIKQMLCFMQCRDNCFKLSQTHFIVIFVQFTSTNFNNVTYHNSFFALN